MSGPDASRLVLLVEDDAPLRDATAQALELAGFEPTALASAGLAKKHVSADFPGCIVTDIRMEGMDGLALMKWVNGIDPDLPVILVTGHGDIAMAVAALKDGAFDFLAKPFSADQLAASVRRALQARTLVLDNRRLRRDAEHGIDEFVGTSQAMAKLRATVGQMAMIDLDLLIEGESGTGKELAARALHRRSARALRSFTALRCSSLDDWSMVAGLLDGSAGGANGSGHGGVVFLDEIEALPPSSQARLLAYLEDRERQAESLTGVRVIAATCASLDAAVREGRFREDLFYRLSLLRIRIPPLRERREDVTLLFAQFVREALDRTRRKRFDMTVADRRRLLEYDWPGNARELRNYAYNAVLDLPRIASGELGTARPALQERVAAFERMIVSEALQQAAGNVTAACGLLKISRQGLYEKIARHGLDLTELRRRT